MTLYLALTLPASPDEISRLGRMAKRSGYPLVELGSLCSASVRTKHALIVEAEPTLRKPAPRKRKPAR